MTPMRVREPQADQGTNARTARRALRAEKAQLLRWRRLLRARLDLVIAGCAPPDTLGAMSWDILPDAQMSLPRPQELLEAIRVPATDDHVTLIQRLRELDKMLAAYDIRIDAALEASSQKIVRGLAAPNAPHEAAR